MAFKEEKFFRTRRTWAMSIQQQITAARSDAFRSGFTIEDMTRNDTALNWFTVARTVAASWDRLLSLRDQTAPRHW